MSDVNCAICNEPWEMFHVQNEMNIEDGYDAKDKFLSGKGCPACGWGERCSACSGTGKHTDCKRCFLGNGVILAWKPVRNHPGYVNHHWYAGYDPKVKDLGYQGDIDVFRKEKSFESADGWVEQAWVKCPDCKMEGDDCFHCKGTGKPPIHEDLDLRAAESEISASDEDPAVILERRGLI